MNSAPPNETAPIIPPSEDEIPQNSMQITSEELNFEAALQFQQMMMLYDSGAKQVMTRLEIINREYHVNGKRNPICSIESRLKSPPSIAKKLRHRGFLPSLGAMMENLTDIAGVRVICSYISDIYSVRDMIANQKDLRIVREADYIKHPKPSGYRSYHMIVEIPLFLSDTECHVKVEVQIRTMAMDFWASLEHQIRYKTKNSIPEDIAKELQECAMLIHHTDREMEEIATEMNVLDDPGEAEIIVPYPLWDKK